MIMTALRSRRFRPVNGGMIHIGEQLPIRSGDQDWLVSWHRPSDPPPGIRHGAEGVCVTPLGEVVLISRDGMSWDLPAGRPEPGETSEDTLRREMLEEACANVRSSRLLGFVRGECVAGHELGRALVRSIWRAEVDVGEWDPQFEIPHRRIVAPADVMTAIGPNPFAAVIRRELHEAEVLVSGEPDGAP